VHPGSSVSSVAPTWRSCLFILPVTLISEGGAALLHDIVFCALFWPVCEEGKLGRFHVPELRGWCGESSLVRHARNELAALGDQSSMIQLFPSICSNCMTCTPKLGSQPCLTSRP
jgi:hypothetical protein